MLFKEITWDEHYHLILQKDNYSFLSNSKKLSEDESLNLESPWNINVALSTTWVVSQITKKLHKLNL